MSCELRKSRREFRSRSVYYNVIAAPESYEHTILLPRHSIERRGAVREIDSREISLFEPTFEEASDERRVKNSVRISTVSRNCGLWRRVVSRHWKPFRHYRKYPCTVAMWFDHVSRDARAKYSLNSFQMLIHPRTFFCARIDNALIREMIAFGYIFQTLTNIFDNILCGGIRTRL